MSVELDGTIRFGWLWITNLFIYIEYLYSAIAECCSRFPFLKCSLSTCFPFFISSMVSCKITFECFSFCYIFEVFSLGLLVSCKIIFECFSKHQVIPLIHVYRYSREFLYDLLFSIGLLWTIALLFMNRPYLIPISEPTCSKIQPRQRGSHLRG